LGSISLLRFRAGRAAIEVFGGLSFTSKSLAGSFDIFLEFGVGILFRRLVRNRRYGGGGIIIIIQGDQIGVGCANRTL
jgi:hypothetical protein